VTTHSSFASLVPRKSRQGFPRRLVPLRCVCVEVCCVERRSNGAVPACHWTNGLQEALVRCQLVGPTIPDTYNLSPATIPFKPAVLSYRCKNVTSSLSLFRFAAETPGKRCPQGVLP
jgi:hypothetical protein